MPSKKRHLLLIWQNVPLYYCSWEVGELIIIISESEWNLDNKLGC